MTKRLHGGGLQGKILKLVTQLNPPLHMKTPKGEGWAHFVIDYGTEAALLWVVFMDADGACWTVPNYEIRLTSNWTMGRRLDVSNPDSETKREPEEALPRGRQTLAIGG
jgi:hypothetical protein